MDLDLSKFHLDFERGRIYRLLKKYHTYEIAGSKHNCGYTKIRIDGKDYLVHRILYEKYHNVKLDPKIDIDHINKIRNDNRISNLRVVSRKLNCQNQGKQCNNKCGFKNISYHKQTKKWQVQINSTGKNKHYGLFENISDAILKRDNIIKHLNENNNCIFYT